MRKTNFFIIFIFVLALFLGGCGTVDKDKGGVVKAVEKQPEPSKEAIQKADSSKSIAVVDSFDVIVSNFKDCVSSQYFESNDPNIKTIVIFGKTENNCVVMLNKDNFKDNYKCYFTIESLSNSDIIKQFYYNKDYGVKADVDKYCKKIQLEPYKSILTDPSKEILQNNVISDKDASKNLKNAVPLKNNTGN